MAQSFSLVTCMAACLLWSSEASHVIFADEAGPEQYYLHGRYRYFVATNSIAGGVASWKLANMKFSAADKIEAGAVLHAALVPIKVFKTLVEENAAICDDTRSFLWGSKDGVVSTTLTTEAKTEDLKIPHGGPHMLILANCAVSGATTITGKSGVQNSWGSLDNVDYWKVPVYGCALVLSFICFIVYIAGVAQQEEEVRDVQYYCVLLSLIGIIEAGAQCATLYMENAGENPWYHIVEAVYLAKVMYGFTFMLQMAQGLGFTTGRLDCMATAKCYLIVLCYLVAAMPKICLFSIRPHLAAVHTSDVLSSTGPLVVVTALALTFLVWSLRCTFSMLRKRDDTEALQAAKRIALLVFVVITIATATLGVQIVLGSSQEDVQSLWMYAFWNDAVASACFVVATAVMMYLSMENYVGKSLQMGSLPTQDLDLEEVDETAMQIDQMDEEEESAFVGSKGKGPSAEKIGASGASGAVE